MDEQIPRDEQHNARLAVDRAIGKYITSRKEKVPSFVKTHFSIKGALGLNRKALGADLYKAPLNVIWALPYTGLRAAAPLFKKMGFIKIQSTIERLPVGFETRIQKEIFWLIFTELLEIPCEQGKRRSNKDALLEQVLNEPEISLLISNAVSNIYPKLKNPGFRSALEKSLLEYSRSRTAAAELAGSIISLSAGATMFGEMTPGAVSAGGAIATAIAQQTAISNFVLGPSLGSVYYGLFPVSASTGLVIASTGAVMAGLAIIASFSGIVTDPIQYKLGIHQKRLNTLIDCLESELRGKGESGFKNRDQYVARVFDLVDLIKKAATTFV
jgi:hypothetical protein